MSTPISSSTSPASTTPASSNALVTSTGIGSGLNIPAIVSSLTTAYGAAENNQLSTQQTTLQTQVSGYGTFSSALDTLQATLSSLETPTQLAGFSAAVADKTVATATASSTAVAGQYSLAVQNLATSAILTSSTAVASASTAIGTGTLTIAVGGNSTAINITSSDNTLGGIANAINTASNNPGVSASVITTKDGARLVLSGTTTGAANAITVNQSGGDGGLSALVYNPTGGTNTLTQTQAAADANFTLNNNAAVSASNIVSGAISGVTINLVGASVGTTSTTLSVTPDTTAASTSIGTFVTALNGVLSSIQSLTAYDPSTKTAGPLQGNGTIEAFQNQLSQILDSVTSGGAGGINSLASVGISANTQGTYDTNSNTLSNALSSNLTAVGNLLGGTNGIASKIDALIGGYTKPGGLLATINQGLQSGLKNVASEQTQLNAQLATYSATLTAQYNAMDTAIAALKQTQAYLTAEFNAGAISSAASSTNSSLSSGNTSSTGG
jgi:flagellar hook-associated protein 2